jgi:hypothetical protein
MVSPIVIYSRRAQQMNDFDYIHCIRTCRLKTSDYRKRCVTAILYLNKRDWDCSADADGGALCCYLGAAPEDDIGIQYILLFHS